MLLLLTPRSAPQLSSWGSLFLSVFLCLFYGAHVLLFLIYAFCWSASSNDFSRSSYGRYIFKTLLSLKISLFYFTIV